MKLLTTILASLLLSLSSTYTAKLVRISNGDTITILTDNKEQIRIRLKDTFYEVFGTIKIYSRMNLQHIGVQWRKTETE
jgi:hypothetical protein